MPIVSEFKKPNYLLLTPGPLSTTDSVRSAMRYDSCTWDQDYKAIVTDIRENLLRIAGCDPTIYTTILMQGSGTFGVESVLGSSINKQQHKILILANGVYGRRMVMIVKILEIPHHVYEVDENQPFHVSTVENILEQDKTITHIAMVHCETTTGILNDLKLIATLAQTHNKYLIVDAMSSFGGIKFDIVGLGIDFLISSANKCLQGVPGFSFVICKKEILIQLCQNNAKSLSLDLFGQWQEMEKDPGKWRYTSPTHVVLAFHQALIEFEQEGGVSSRAARYGKNQKLLVEGMIAMGFKSYIPAPLQSHMITTFLEPDYIPNTNLKFSFKDFYQYLKLHGFVIYPGKVTHRNTFRIGSIGNIFPEDVAKFLRQVQGFIDQSSIVSYEH